MNSTNKKAYLNCIDYLLAPIEVTNENLVERYPEFTKEDIYKKTQINKRYNLPKNSLVSDFATLAGDVFFKKHNVDKFEIDYFIFCTESPDYTAPATSCIIQYKLGLRQDVGTMDLSFGCSGYTYGLLYAKALIESKLATKVLFITADMPTLALSEEQSDYNFLFSDGASVSVISDEEVGFEIGDFVNGTDGGGEKNLRIQSSGYHAPKNINWYTNSKTKNLLNGIVEMEGEELFRFAIQKVPVLVRDILNKNQCDIEDIDLFVFHQASSLILKSLKRKLKIPDEKFIININEFGNTVSASIPIALEQARQNKLISPKMKIMLVGFGVGYSWSGTVIERCLI